MMSAGKLSEERNIRLIRPYTFDECDFDFKDPRTFVPIAHFGTVDIAQTFTERPSMQDVMSGAAAFHSAFDEQFTLSEPSLPKATPPHEVSEWIGAVDAVHIAEKEPILLTVVERLGGAAFAVHEQHGHIYMDFTERIDVFATILPPLQTTIVERSGIRKEQLLQPSTLIVESVDVGKNQGEMPYTAAQEKIGARMTRAYNLAHVLKDGAAMRDERGQAFIAHRSFAEGITLRWLLTQDLQLCRTFIERLGVSAALVPQAQSSFTEQIVFREMLLPPLTSNFTERIGVYDGLQRASEAALSGVAIGNGMTLADFKSRLIRPVGYETFRPFHVGEYEYEKALVRISMSAGSLGAIPQIYDVVMNVDIDDTVDRGTARLEAKETEISYHKHYYTKPEVTVALMSGNTADGVLAPEITFIGTDAFRCILRKRDGTAAAGLISWTAVGY